MTQEEGTLKRVILCIIKSRNDEVFRVTMYLNNNLAGIQVTTTHENTKITTDCWTTIDKLDLNLPAKTFYTHRRKKKSQWDEEGHFHNIIKSQTCWWATRVWKTITSQMFSHRSEGSEHHIRFPSLGVLCLEDEPPEHLDLKARGA